MDEQKRRVYPERRRRVSLVGPVILIGLGVIFLLNSMGVLAWSVWEAIFRLWPVLLIAAGLEIILSRLSAWGSLLALVLTVAVLAGALWLLGPDIGTGQVVAGEEITQALGEASRAEVVIEPGVGALYIEALPESANLVEGVVRVGRGQRVKRHFAVAGKTATFTLQTEGATFGPFIGWGDQWSWKLGLAPEAPLGLEVSLSVGLADIDLTGLAVSDLKVSMGVGRTTVTLPDEGRFQARIEGAIGETVIVIPTKLAARIRVDTGLAVSDLPDGYQQRDDVYTSPNYASADDRVDLEVSQAIGKVTIRQSSTW
ncbi:MAG: hypothetical protein H8E47_01710 [Anaerolineales bacterium]|nr:hypothetical protein [Anaerolineales bacterium]